MKKIVIIVKQDNVECALEEKWIITEISFEHFYLIFLKQVLVT